jgi:hypothetical protein
MGWRLAKEGHSPCPDDPMIQRFLDFLQKLLTDNKEWSLSRFQLFFTALLSNLIVWPMWWIICVKKGEIVDIPAGVGMALGIANGVSALVYGVGRNQDRQDKTAKTARDALKDREVD